MIGLRRYDDSCNYHSGKNVVVDCLMDVVVCEHVISLYNIE